MSEFSGGTTPNTQMGAINRNNQQCGGTRRLPGNDHLQFSYRMKCLQADCGEVYGSNGSDVFQRKCPSCQGGRPGIDF
jgi:hypothetical protein